MKKFLICIILTLLTGQIAMADNSNVVKLNQNDIEKRELMSAYPQCKVNGSLLVNDSATLEKMIETQKEHDIKDLELLWKGTVENNQVIAFALKKLATPESQRRIHSSLMSKTLSAVISGASFVPSLIGANAAVQTSAFSAGRLAQGLLNRQNIPQETPLTDTELIELASMVEDLQDTLIASYYNYKNSLMQLKATRSKMLLYSKNYAKSNTTSDVLEISISQALYDTMRLQEYTLEQNVKKYHIQLQRLAGKNAVEALELYQYDFDSVMYKNTSTQKQRQAEKGGKK